MIRTMLLGALAALIAPIVATPIATPLSLRQIAVPPSKDPFYTPAAGFEKTKPGTILNSRPSPQHIAVFGTIPANIKGAYQLLYRTSDSRGDATAAVTTVLIPNNANFSRLVSYQDFEDSAALDCAPSYISQFGSGNNGSFSQIDFLLEAGLLNENFVVALPDYEGPTAAFASGFGAGYATLDNIRAVLASESITGVKEDASVTMWGYSGGSIATEWAAELQPHYAPELKILGAAMGGNIANLTSLLYEINNTTFAGFIPAGILGLKAAYPNLLDDWYEANIVPETRAKFEEAKTQCAIADLQGYPNQNIGKYFRHGLASLMEPAPQSVLKIAGLMGKNGLPTIPLYFYKAVQDQISPSRDTDALVDSYCKAGVGSLRYYRNTVGEHFTEAILGSVGALAFLKQSFSGVRVYGCDIQDVEISRIDDPGNELEGLTDELVAVLKSLLIVLPLGGTIGPLR